MAFAPFSTLPLGLPNLFGLTGQATPKGMEELIRAQLEVLQFVAGANCREVIVAANLAVAGPGVATFPELTVPDGEAWLVLGASVGFTTTGAEHLRARALVLRDTNVSPNQCPWKLIGEGTSSPALAAAASNVQIVTDGVPFIMQANDNIAVAVMNYIGGATINVSARAVIFRFTA